MEKLTFGQIADAWALEMEEGGSERDDVLHRLVQGMWLGEFEPGGKSMLSLVVPGCALEPGTTVNEDGVISDLEKAGAITRGGLLRVLELKGVLPQLPAASQSASANSDNTFAALSTMTADQFGPLVWNAYMEILIVSKDDFSVWCDCHDIPLPVFWFAGQA